MANITEIKLHPLTKELKSCLKEAYGCHVDKIIREWLKEKAEEWDMLTKVDLKPLLELNEEQTLWDKFNETLPSTRLFYSKALDEKMRSRTIKSLIKIVEEHYKGEENEQ